MLIKTWPLLTELNFVAVYGSTYTNFNIFLSEQDEFYKYKYLLSLGIL